ncbi:hypothetical protein RclHR1_08280007 [Rhizophagus clarus]|uniref:Uncharacterized protein n=1 Tax=Rhizophagus clarus TaxID=94130 RepID=A0A2Z6SN67_9GLOM|nr:hypothetical protein RclHR1_08280007 [Rhizophagus clarus]
MSLIRSNINGQTSWNPSELAQVLNFLDDNFDKWYNNNYNLCVKAKEATDVMWDAQSIYNKVHSLFCIVGEYLESGKKSTACTIIWEHAEIYEIVKRIYLKTKKRMKEEEQKVARIHKSNGHIDKILNADQITIEARIDRPCSIETIINLCDVKTQEVNNSATKSLEKVEAEYKERIGQISQYQSELIKQINETKRMINVTNQMVEDFRKF